MGICVTVYTCLRRKATETAIVSRVEIAVAEVAGQGSQVAGQVAGQGSQVAGQATEVAIDVAREAVE